MDCTRMEGNRGCEEALSSSVVNSFKYIEKNGGIDTEENYPYTAEFGTCHYRPEDIGATCKGYRNILSRDCPSLLDAVANIDPISVAMDASHRDFQLYKKGTYDPLVCSDSKLDHSTGTVTN